MHRAKSGFTLVELLVVITVIGVLIAMLIPAINMIREQSRQTVCRNNQKQLGVAILAYEQGKQKLPGVLDVIPGTTPVTYTWLEAILPNLEHQDYWEYIRSNNVAAIAALRVTVATCPIDPYLSDPTSTNGQALLSYGVSDQFFVDKRPMYNNPHGPPTDRKGQPAAEANSTNLKTRPLTGFPFGQTVTSAQTIMLGERTVPDTNAAVSGSRAGKWTDTTANAWKSLTFPWQAGPVPITPAVMASTHGSSRPNTVGTVVVVTYFDGHGMILPAETTFP